MQSRKLNICYVIYLLYMLIITLVLKKCVNFVDLLKPLLPNLKSKIHLNDSQLENTLPRIMVSYKILFSKIFFIGLFLYLSYILVILSIRRIKLQIHFLITKFSLDWSKYIYIYNIYYI